MCKKNFCFTVLVILSFFATKSFSQNIAINEDGTAANPNAILDIKSFNKGILIPRVSTAARLAIPNTKGLLVFDSTAGSFFFNTGTAWQNLGGTSVAPGWQLTGNSGTGSFLGTTDSTPLVIKVFNQPSGLIDPVPGNTFWGNNAGANTLPDNANFNTSIGHFSMFSNTEGSFNTSAGSFSLRNNVTGQFNTSMGFNSLMSNSTGNFNTANGGLSLQRNTTGFANTAIGHNTMFLNTAGDANTAIGYGSLRTNGTGSNNTAIGSHANVATGDLSNATVLGANARVDCSNCLVLGSINGINDATSGVNVGIGTSKPDPGALLELKSTDKGLLIPRMTTEQRTAIVFASKGMLVFDSTAGSFFYNTGSAWQNIASGNTTWTLAGNSGTDPVNQFIGTTDNQPLRFRINNIKAGELNPVNGNIFWGKNAGQSNTTGYSNIAIGSGALKSVANRSNLVAIGDSALFNNINDAPNDYYSSHGAANTAIGSKSLFSNTTGSYNTAIGYLSLYSTTTAERNTAIGNLALLSNIGSRNTAIGDNALQRNYSGGGNTAIGANALLYNEYSSGNVAIGYGAGSSHYNGWNNTFIGAGSGTFYNGLYNCIAIGNNAVCNANNQVRIGNSSTTSIGGYAPWTNISDGRYKKNIKEDVKGLDFIMKLRPVTYQLDITGIGQKLNEGNGREKDEHSQKAIAEKEKMIQTGFVAQEVEKAAREAGYSFSGVDIPKSENEFYGLRYSEFVVPLVKAVQEQQKTIIAQKQKMEEQDKKMADLQQQIDGLKKMIR